MFRSRCAVVVCVIAVCVCGCSREFAATSSELGSSLSGKGLITEHSTDFSFKYDKSGRMKDLFNYIYFEGDTLCFNTDFTQDIDGDVSGYFTDPSSGKKFRVERLEKIRSRVYGFSLVGSILEQFMHDSLDAPVPVNGHVIEKPFIVTVEANSGGKKAIREMHGVMKVRY